MQSTTSEAQAPSDPSVRWLDTTVYVERDLATARLDVYRGTDGLPYLHAWAHRRHLIAASMRDEVDIAQYRGRELRRMLRQAEVNGSFLAGVGVLWHVDADGPGEVVMWPAASQVQRIRVDP